MPGGFQYARAFFLAPEQSAPQLQGRPGEGGQPSHQRGEEEGATVAVGTGDAGPVEFAHTVENGWRGLGARWAALGGQVERGGVVGAGVSGGHGEASGHAPEATGVIS